MAETIVAARPETASPALKIDGEHVGVFRQHPARWCDRRRAQHHFHPMTPQGFDRPVQPTPIEPAGLRLYPALGEFADANPGQADFRHAARVFLPPGFFPVFGILTGSEGSSNVRFQLNMT